MYSLQEGLSSINLPDFSSILIILGHMSAIIAERSLLLFLVISVRGQANLQSSSR